MLNKKNLQFQIVEFTATGANTIIPIKFNVNQEFKRVHALFTSSTSNDVSAAATIRLTHDGRRVLPSGFDFNLLRDRDNVAMRDYAHLVDLQGESVSVEGEIVIGSPANTPSYPQTLKLVLVCSDQYTTE